ncbi:MAG TPA: Uma2 family endonuclease [Chloroflexota bacterium]|nr:Uma2 family endonuclease [Chloroflexota bacterium]
MVTETLHNPTVYTDRLVRADDLAAMPGREHFELVLGRLVPVAPASTDHGALGANLTRLVMNYVHDHQPGRAYIAETGFDITRPGERGQTVLGADLAFIATDRVPPRGRKPAFKKVAPDLVYELASGGQTVDEMADKARLWTSRGVRLCWIQWPERRTIDVWRPGDAAPRTPALDDDLDGGDVLPGFRCPVAAAFE